MDLLINVLYIRKISIKSVKLKIGENLETFKKNKQDELQLLA